MHHECHHYSQPLIQHAPNQLPQFYEPHTHFQLLIKLQQGALLNFPKDRHFAHPHSS